MRSNPAARNPPSASRNPKSRGPQSGSASDSGTTRGTLWVLDGKYVRPISVQVGPNDGSMTEVQGRDLTEGLEIVMGVQAKATAQTTDSTNPFAPRFPRGGPRGGGGGGGAGGAGGPRGGGGAGGPPSR